MNLSQVLGGVTLLRTSAPLPVVDVRGIAYDSRKVEPGFLFFAFSGAKTDGAQFAAVALPKRALSQLWATVRRRVGFPACGCK